MGGRLVRRLLTYVFLATAAQAAGWLPSPGVAAQNAAVTLYGKVAR